MPAKLTVQVELAWEMFPALQAAAERRGMSVSTMVDIAIGQIIEDELMLRRDEQTQREAEQTQREALALGVANVNPGRPKFSATCSCGKEFLAFDVGRRCSECGEVIRRVATT
ncbi:MAG TPA: hypothetical protein VN838_12135 [Bradyrhizobium sp.]|nr:hypothetical protein [Bradyrhizobium sp.]